MVNTFTQNKWPQWVEHQGEDDDECQSSVQLTLDLAPLPEPHVVHIFLGLLLALDLDVPLTLDSLGLFPAVCVRLSLDDSQGKHAQRQELEGIFEGRTVGDLGQQRVLLAGFLVCWRLQSTEGSLD